MSSKALKIFTLFILAIFFVSAGFKCKLETPEIKEAMKPITLEYWRTFDDKDSFKEILDAYKALHPNITIEYKKFRYEEYEEKILEALAEDRGPDIFSIHNSWINEYKSKIEPMPKSVKIPFQEVKGSIKKEIITTIKTVPSISLIQLKNDFVEVVYDDCVQKDEEDQDTVLCLPLSVDTVALFYNRDLLNASGIPFPPKTWVDFQEAVKKITKYDEDNNVIQSAAALGTSSNISRFSDILSLIMMQNGTKMSEGGKVMFNAPVNNSKYVPGFEAFKFYTAFANPTSEVYTWNNKMPNSLEAFIQGKTAFFFGYSYNLPMIKSRAPKLNFGIAPVPQISSETGEHNLNISNYWVEAVSKKSANRDVAWNFIQFETTQSKLVSNFLGKTKKPAALRALINDQLNDIDINPFVLQVLTAKSWYQGKDAGAMEGILGEMIDSVKPETTDDEEYMRLLNTAAGKIQQTY